MKNTLFLSLLFVVAAHCSTAQITPKSYVLGGNASFSHSNPAGDGVDVNRSATQFRIQPSAGKFISQKWLLETSLGYSFNRDYFSINDYTSDSKSHGVGATFSVSRFFPLGERFYFTLSPRIGVNSSFGTRTVNDGSFSNNSDFNQFETNASFNGGLAYFIHPKWMLTANVGSLGYQTIFHDDSSIGHNINFSVIGNSFSFGARFILGTDK